MISGADLRTAFRIARRELRGGPRFFKVFLACLALGVGAIACVGILSESLEKGIRKDARRLLGGDLEIRRSHLPVENDVLLFIRDFIGPEGRIARSIQTRTMIRIAARLEPRTTALHQSGENLPKRNLLVELKGVDKTYPLYGRAELSSGMGLDAALAGKDGLPGAVAAPALFERANIRPGDVIRIGDADFVLMDVLEREPDRVSSFFRLGPRVMIRASDTAKTGIIRPGSMIRYVYSVRTGERADVQVLKKEIAARFPESSGWRIRDFSQSSAGLKRFIDNLGQYLLLVGLAVLLTGGIGAASGVKRFLDSRMTSIAAMKCVGGDNRQVFLVYLLQILCMAVIGSVLGLLLGWATAAACGKILASVAGLPIAGGVPVAPLVFGAACGILTTLAFSLPVLSGAVRVSPVRLFSGYADPAPRRCGIAAGIGSAVSVCCMLLVVPLLTGSPGPVFGFAAAVAAGAGILALCARFVRMLARNVSGRGPLRFRHAVRNLHRPGSATTNVLFSLGLGLTVISAVVQLEYLLDDRIGARISETAPSYFFLDIPDGEINAFRSSLLDVPGVERVDAGPSIRGRIVAVNGVESGRVDIAPESAWALRGDRSMSFSGPMPEGTEITAGEWWAEDYDGPPCISFDAKVARDMGLEVGGNMTLNVLGREITAQVACLREIDWSAGRLDHTIVFSPGVLEDLPHTWLGAVYAAPEGEKRVFNHVSEKYPFVSMVYLKDVLEDVREVIGTAAMAVHAAAALALISGLLVLAETLRAGMVSRYREAVIFKVCGATGADIVRILTLEFVFLGCIASVAAIILGAALSFGFAALVMRMDWVFFPMPAVVVCLGGVSVVAASGLMGVRRILRREAWIELRNE